MSCLKNMDDRLSMLPDEIVSQILNLVPLKYAVQTSVLSKRWRYAWMLVTNLEFDYVHSFRNMSKSVDRVMEVYTSLPIQLFRFGLHNVTGLVRESSVSNWIDKAVRLDVRELDIDVMKLSLPLSMFTCKTLTKLRLNRGSYDQSVWECPSLVYLPCLKTLEISVYSNPFVNAFKLIHGCPVLESLSFDVKLCHKDEEDYIFKIPTLRRLNVRLPVAAGPSVINKVVLNVPNTEYLYVGGTSCSIFVIEDVSSLVEACVSCPKITDDFLKRLNGVKSLSVHDMRFVSELHFPIFPNLKHLELKGFLNSTAILQIFKSCPELKHLYIKEKQTLAWDTLMLGPACKLASLATIKFSTCKLWRYDIPFLEYMLGNAKVLKTLTVTWEFSSDTDEEKRLLAKLLKLPRASRCCEIRFHGNWSHYTSTSS